MRKVIADISMSLDGFVTGEGADVQHGLGDAPDCTPGSWIRTPSTRRSSTNRRRRAVL
jgi:hypothetical protein